MYYLTREICKSSSSCYIHVVATVNVMSKRMSATKFALPMRQMNGAGNKLGKRGKRVLQAVKALEHVNMCKSYTFRMRQVPGQPKTSPTDPILHLSPTSATHVPTTSTISTPAIASNIRGMKTR